MVRYALAPDGIVTPDLAGRLPGRGAWTEARREAVVRAAGKGLFARAFRKPARLPEGETAEGFAARIEAGLERRALDALGLARRAGKAVAGFEKSKAALGKDAAALLVACEAGDSADKLVRLAAGRPVIRAFSAAAQSAALGCENATYAVLAGGVETDRFLRETDRLSGFRPVYAANVARKAETV